MDTWIRNHLDDYKQLDVYKFYRCSNNLFFLVNDHYKIAQNAHEWDLHITQLEYIGFDNVNVGWYLPDTHDWKEITF